MLPMTIRQLRSPSLNWAVVGLVIGLVWSGITLNLWHDYDSAIVGATKDTANLARAFDENITRTVEAVDETLLFARAAWQTDHSVAFLDKWARSSSFLNDIHIQIAMADRAGHAVWSNLGPADGINIGDREHFQIQKTSTADFMFISKPVLGKVSKKWSIQFVRKLMAPDGAFDGIVVVSLDPDYLSRFYESISIGNGSVSLSTADGTILARVPAISPVMGASMPQGMRDRLLSGAASGGFRMVSEIDGTDRITNFRRLAGYPLLVTVGFAAKDVLSPYERNKLLYLASGLVLTISIVIVGMVMQAQRRSLIDSRQSLAVTLENMSQGIVMVRGDGSVPVVNQRAIELLGLQPALFTRTPNFQDVVDWQTEQGEFEGLTDSEPVLAGLLRSDRTCRQNYRYERTRPNGTVLEVHSRALEAGGSICTYTDITEQKAAETALAAAQARAAHAERMQALGQLAGGIAHDFNNILQAVQGAAALIDKRAGDAGSVRRFARLIGEASERGSSITRRLLSFARRGELRAEPVETASLLYDLREVLQHTLGSPIAVEVDIGADLPALLADKGQLETALVNLATNARDAMESGGTLTFIATAETVTASAAHPADLLPGRYVCLSIGDTGAGMDEDLLTRVVEPFFTTKPIGQGTGLGLSMVKGFVEQSGGGMTIASRAGQGTVVSLWLPAAEHDAPAEPMVPRQPSGRIEWQKRILLVDDEAMVRGTLAASMEDAGYAVVVSGSGAEALAMLRTSLPVDVLVSDLSMPGMDGIAVIKEARALRPGLPAVLLTGYAGQGAQLAVGAELERSFMLVRKPVTAKQLSDRIETLLAATPVA